MQRLTKKAILDIWKNGKRTILAFVAMTLGMTFFGLMLFSSAIMTREIKSVYQERNPASASFEIVGNSDTAKLAELLDSVDQIEEYELKTVTETQIEIGDDNWKQVYVFGIPDNKEINQLKFTDGKMVYDGNSAMIETGAVDIAGKTIGDTVVIKNERSEESSYKLTGVVNDLSVHPATVHRCVYLYVPLKNIKPETIDGYILDFKTSNPYDLSTIELASQELSGKLKDAGFQISEMNIPETPGESMHAKEYDSTMFILQVFSFIALLFGGMITANLISSIMDSQMKQIGIMKSVGAKTSQIYTSYFTAFGIHFLGCVLVALAAVNIFSGYLSIVMLKISDIIPENTSVATGYNVLFCVISIVIPMITVALPLLKGCKLSVRQAFDYYGLSQVSVTKTFGLTHINRPLALSIRNVFRKKKRLVLNIALLTFSGVAFISIITIYLSLRADLDTYMSSLKYNYQFQVGQNDTEDSLARKLDSVEEIKNYEIWGGGICSFVGNNDIEKICAITAPHKSSEMIVPDLLEGCWIGENSAKSVVISEELAKKEGWKTGDKVTLFLMGKEDRFEICGVLKAFEKKEIYFSQELLQNYIDKENWTLSVKCITENSGTNSKKFTRELNAVLEQNGIVAISGENSSQMKTVLFNHFAVTLNSCLVVSILLVFVSGFGLSASMSVQAEERKKEIGILKAVGAGKKDIYRMMLAEGKVLSILGYFITVPISICVSIVGCKIFGSYVFDKAIIFDGMSCLISCGIWFAFSFMVCYYAVKQSAKKNSKLTIREVLIQ